MDSPMQVSERENLLAVLKAEQEQSGCVSKEFMEQTAQSFDLALGEVYGLATFYHFISTKSLGRNVIRVCKSIPCYLKSSQLVIETLQHELSIAPGETTPDGKFSLQLTNCIGACDQAPAMLLNHDLHGNLTPAKILQILEAYQ